MDNNSLESNVNEWVKGRDYPEFFDEISLATISKGYLLPGETPKKAYRRVAHASANRLNRPDLENKFFKMIWNGWLGLASPVLSNMGTDRGLPISCFGVDTPDSIRGIGLTVAELMKLTSVGGGVGVSLSRIRSRGDEIRGNGMSEGIVPWAKIYDSAIIATNQGNVRRGAASVNLDINHGDIDEFLEIRRPKGDPNRQCLNLHQCVVVDDTFMRKLESRDSDSMNRWAKILKARMETGEPYIMFKDNVNKVNPISYMMNNLEVSMTNICVTGDTKINIKVEDKKQEIEIQDLEFILQTSSEVYILSYNLETLKKEYKLITNYGVTNPEAELLEIEDEITGFKLQCTPEHKILTKNRGWVEAQNLLEDDKLIY